MRIFFLFVALCSLLAGCATSQPSRNYQVLQRTGETVIVVSAKRVQLPSDSMTVMAVGAALGSLAGPKVAALQTTFTFGTGINSIAGAAAGGYGARYLFSDEGLEIVARRDNGDRIAIIQPRNGWTPMIGQEALLVSTEDGPRLLRD